MKIINKDCSATTEFIDVNAGEIFLDNEGAVCMKIKPSPTDEVNAVCLEDGQGYIFSNWAEVTLVEGVLTIGKK